MQKTKHKQTNFVSSWKSADRRLLVPWRNDWMKKEMFLNSPKKNGDRFQNRELDAEEDHCTAERSLNSPQGVYGEPGNEVD